METLFTVAITATILLFCWCAAKVANSTLLRLNRMEALIGNLQDTTSQTVQGLKTLQAEQAALQNHVEDEIAEMRDEMNVIKVKLGLRPDRP